MLTDEYDGTFQVYLFFLSQETIRISGRWHTRSSCGVSILLSQDISSVEFRIAYFHPIIILFPNLQFLVSPLRVPLVFLRI